MNKNKIMNIVKQSPALRKFYKACGGVFFRFIGLFVKTDDKLILINSFGGKKYDDSPNAIFEMKRQDPRFSDYHMV